MTARRLVVLAAVVVLVGLVGMVPTTLARFTDTDAATASFATGNSSRPPAWQPRAARR